MRVEKLALTEFQSWKASEVTLDKPVTVVLGENGVGKTSLARAFELLVRGEPSLTRGNGVVLADMIRLGSKQAVIEGIVRRSDEHQPVTIRRTVTAKGISTAVNGGQATKAVFDFYSPAGLLDASGTFSVLCNVSGFFDLAPDKQKAVLEALVDQAVPAEALTGLPMDPHLKAAPKTLHDIENAYALVYADRRAKKSELDGMQIVQAPRELFDVKAIETKLEGLRAEERELIAKASGQAGSRATLVSQRTDLMQRLEELETSKDGLGPAEDAAAKHLAATGAVKELAALVEKGKTVRARQALLIDWDKRLGAIQGKCVISLEVPCPLNAETKGRIRKDWAAEREKIEGEWGGAPTAKDLKDAQARVDDAKALLDSITQHNLLIEKAKNDLAKLEAKIQATPAYDDEPVKALRARIQKGEGNLAIAQQAAQQQATWLQQGTQRKALDKQLDDLETLCKAFAPKGIREKILGERLGALQTMLNDFLANFGIDVVLTAEPWMVQLNGVPAPLASASERFRAGVAFQVALAALTKVGFIVIDAADILDKTNRGALFALLTKATNEGLLEQAIVMATRQSADAPVPTMPNQIQLLLVSMTSAGSQVTAA